MSATIESVLQENRVFNPSEAFVAQAAVSGMEAYKALCAKAEADYEGYWGELARQHVVWKQPFHKVLDESEAPFYKWFPDGRLNVSYNCLDKNVEAGLGDKVAIIFEADDGTVTRVTYKELLGRVSRFANALKGLGVKKGDRVVIYLPMSIEGVVAMQACARIGATHSVVFGGFSAQSLRDRIEDAGAVLIVTADEQCRGGKNMPLKPAVDEALTLGGCESIKNVVVYRRTGGACTMAAGVVIWFEVLFGIEC
jgi:acetyl-CoA synthetase